MRLQISNAKKDSKSLKITSRSKWIWGLCTGQFLSLPVGCGFVLSIVAK